MIGFDCPACGSLRAVHHLTNLDLTAAASSNLLLVIAVPVILALWLRWLLVSWQGGRQTVMPRVPRPLWITLLVVLAAFTVLRNLPAGAWLHS